MEVAVSPRAVQNLVGGSGAGRPAEALYSTSVEPVHRPGVRERSPEVRRGRRRTRRARRRGRGVRHVARDHAGQRQLALLKLADLVERDAEELVALESENTGKPLGRTAEEEIPPMVDQIRFFAGAARVLEGRSAGEYMAGHTSSVRREPIGVGRPGDARGTTR